MHIALGPQPTVLIVEVSLFLSVHNSLNCKTVFIAFLLENDSDNVDCKC